jgi:hypothetical protein
MATQLNHLAIVGLINKNTPFCVIQEICLSLFKGTFNADMDESIINNIIYRINTNDNPEITLPPSNNDLAKIARFINPSTEWNRQSLLQAHSFFSSYMGLGKTKLPQNSNFVIGKPTPQHPEAYSACILYRLCLDNEIPTSRSTSLELMAMTVKSLVVSFGDLRRTMIQCVREASRETLIKMINCSSPHLLGGMFMSELPLDASKYIAPIAQGSHMTDNVSYESILASYKLIRNSSVTSSPRTRSECIALAASVFKIDLLFDLENIWKSYAHLGKPTLQIHPIQNLELHFNPNIPYELYTDKQLKQLALREGYLEAEIRRQQPYELLQLAYLDETFYPGDLSDGEQKMSLIYGDELETMNADCVVTYGIRAGKRQVFTYEELADHFKTNKNFFHPLSKTTLTDRAIRKLKTLANDSYQLETGRDARSRLLSSITLVEIFQNDKAIKIQEFYDFYEITAQKELVQQLLHRFFRYSMALRGWLGNNEKYPLEIAPVDNPYDVEVFASECITEFESYIEKLKKEQNYDFTCLPLLLYRNGSFIISDDKENGLTIGDRMNLVKEADENKLEACIRRSSNWFTSCAYRYMQLIGVNPPFDINEMREIS